MYTRAHIYKLSLARQKEWNVSVEVHVCACVEGRWREDSLLHETLELEQRRF